MPWTLEMPTIQQDLDTRGRGVNANNLQDLTGAKLQMSPTVRLLVECVTPISRLTCAVLNNKHILRDLTDEQRCCMTRIHATLKEVCDNVERDLRSLAPETVRSAVRSVCAEARQHLGGVSKTQTPTMIRDEILSVEGKL